MRNRTGSIFRPKKGYWKLSHAKITKGAIPGGEGILASADGRANGVAVSESREIERVAHLGQIKVLGTRRSRKLQKERSREGTGYLRAQMCARIGLRSQNRAKSNG